MGAIANGIALHSPGFKSYCATFFIFSDYMRSAMRIAALSGAPTLFVMTHDSIGVGEDGPTHQPIEHLASFRAMPGMLMMRPADGNETAGAYQIGVEQTDRPTTFALSRQVVPNLAGTSREGVRKGAYVVAGPAAGGDCDRIIIGTGTELEARRQRGQGARRQGPRGLHALLGLFEEQSDEYKASILPKGVPTVSIEAGSTFGWSKYADISIGRDDFVLPRPLVSS